MITALQRFLQRHSRWLFAGLLVIIIIPFVFTIGAAPGIGNGKKLPKRSFFGLNLNSQPQMESLQRRTALGLYYENAMAVPMDSAMLTRASWLWMADRLQIPEPTPSQLTAFIHTRPAFQIDQQFSEDRYRQFLKEIGATKSLSEDFAAGVLAEDWRIQLVASVLSGANFTLPIEAQLRQQQMDTQWKVAEATLPFSEFHPQIEVDETLLRNYFEAHHDRYDLPAKTQLKYAFFSAKTDEISAPDGEELQLFFDQNFPLWGIQDDPKEYFQTHRKELQRKYLTALARQTALKKASEFQHQLYTQQLPFSVAEIAEIVGRFGGEMKSLKPYNQKLSKPLDGIPTEILFRGLELNEKDYYSEAMPVENGALVLLFDRRLEARAGNFDKIKPLVEKHYRRAERLKQFSADAKAKRHQLLQAMKNGESFSAAAEALGFRVHSPLEFTLEKLPESLTPQKLGAIIGLSEGQLSPFVKQNPDLELFYVESKIVPAPNSDPEKIDATEKQIQSMTSKYFIRQILEEKMLRELNQK